MGFSTLLQIRKIINYTLQINPKFLTITMTLSYMKAAGLLALTFCATCLSASCKISDLRVGMTVYSAALGGSYRVLKIGTTHDVEWVEIGSAAFDYIHESQKKRLREATNGSGFINTRPSGFINSDGSGFDNTE